MVTFADIPEGAVFGDGKGGVYLKVGEFRARPSELRFRPEANAWELDAQNMSCGRAWFAADCGDLVYPLPARPNPTIETEEEFFANVRRAVRDRQEGRRIEPFVSESFQPPPKAPTD